ncbi:hypothetical protein D9M70_611830 [compost metagenome]
MAALGRAQAMATRPAFPLVDDNALLDGHMLVDMPIDVPVRVAVCGPALIAVMVLSDFEGTRRLREGCDRRDQEGAGDQGGQETFHRGILSLFTPRK